MTDLKLTPDQRTASFGIHASAAGILPPALTIARDALQHISQTQLLAHMYYPG